MPENASPKSKLVIVGLLLILFAMFVPTPLEEFISHRFHMTLALALLIDACKATIFVGIGVLAISLVRERRARRARKSP